MKNKVQSTKLVFVLLFAAHLFGFGQSDVIISQYIETNSGSTPKGIEIFNVSGSDIVFSAVNNLQIYQGTNGGTCNAIGSTNITSGTLAADEVWVIGTSDLTSYATTNGTNLSGTTTYPFSFNGDDALQLYLGGVLQDQFGICGNDPGSSWSGGGVSTSNNNLEIQNGLCDGDTDGWTDPSSRFNQIANGSTMTGFGNAPTSCSSCTDTLDWNNLQSPASGNITVGSNFNVYAQAYELGLTNAAGQGSGVEVWIGYNTTDNDPEANDATWTWTLASYNTDSGNNDEYVAEIGSGLTTGTYYYASRFRLNSCDYTYGGYNIGGGGTWDGSTNVNGVLTVNPHEVDWANIQSPNTNQTITHFDTFNVYAQTYEPSVTDAAGQGAGVEAWIGYHTTDNDPEANDASWTWVVASYNTDSGNNDEYVAEIGSSLAPGTYYYASRFRLNSGPFVYGGTGGIWSNDSVELVVEADLVDFCNVDYPKTATINQGDNFNVYAQAYEPGETNASAVAASPNLEAWVGYNTTDNDPEANDATWTWVAATYDSDDGNNDQFTAEIGSSLSAGTYYFASRFRLNGSDYSYGGIFADNSGDFWDSVTNNNGILTVTDSPCSQLFISEYVEGSSNNKYIEIYNPTSSAVTLTGNYDIAIYSNGSASVTTTINLTGSIAAYDVFVLSHSSAAVYTGTVNQTSGSLAFNGDDAIALINSGTIIDVIGQIGTDPGSEWSGATCTAGTENGTLVRNSSVQSGDSDGSNAFDPDTEWTCSAIDDVSNLGSHTSTCVSCTQTITNFSPTSGAVGTVVTITGTGFTAGSTVEFNGVSATVTYVNGTTLNATVPSGATTGVITVTEAGCSLDSASDFTVTACSPSHTITSFAPSTGPELTEVTIIGTGFTGSSTVEFGGVSATIVSQTATELVVEVPSGAVTGAITVIESSCPVLSASNYTLLDSSNCSLSGSMPAGFTDLLISGVYDDAVSSCHYIELLNPTASDIDLSTFALGFDNNFTLGSAVPVSGFTGAVTLSGTISAESTYMIQVTTVAGGCTACPTITPDYTFVGSLGINDEDRIVLVSDYGTGSAAAQDVWQNHSNGAGYNVGYVFPRSLSATAPSATFNNADWVLNDTEDCFGFSISSTQPPTVDTQPSDISGCDSNTFSITASAGNGGSLTYQWRYNDGTASGWSDVTSGAFSPGTVTGETTNSLTITGFNLDGYQFYCAVTEDSACTVTSDAAQYKATLSSWNGTSWSNGLPDINTIAVIEGDYNTNVGGQQVSFNTCNLIVNAGSTLTISNGDYVNVQHDVFINGSIYIQTQGALVQVDNTGIVSLDTNGSNTVSKTTSPLQYWYDYTYWSSPLSNASIGDALSFSNPSYRWYFDASSFNDTQIENANTNTFSPGQDDIDDEGDDWAYAGANHIMVPGMGYAAMHSPVGFITPNSGFQYLYVGNSTTNGGAFNTGDINVNIYINPGAVYNDWNFIGNPYPSAIDTDEFFTDTNAFFESTIYVWSHSIAPDSNASGNENMNFSTNDYATINGSGGAAGASGIVPNKYIPSGQGFFIRGKKSYAGGAGYYNVTAFNNSMRDTGNNDQFFRIDNFDNDIRLNLTTDNGVFSQIYCRYMDNATNGFDGSFYDAFRNLSTDNASILYSLIDNEDSKYVIQGRGANSLDINEVIKLGFWTRIDTPIIYTLSLEELGGNFMNTNNVYVIDYFENTIHNLKESDYNFTSDAGEFNTRFEIVFNPNALGLSDLEIDQNSLSIIELQNGSIKFSVASHLEMESVEILDLLGRTLYKLDADGHEEIYNLNIAQATYIAKVTLSNGYVITKKAIKRY